MRDLGKLVVDVLNAMGMSWRGCMRGKRPAMLYVSKSLAIDVKPAMRTRPRGWTPWTAVREVGGCVDGIRRRTFTRESVGDLCSDAGAQAVADEDDALRAGTMGHGPVPRGAAVESEAVLAGDAGRVCKAAVVDGEHVDGELGAPGGVQVDAVGDGARGGVAVEEDDGRVAVERVADVVRVRVGEGRAGAAEGLEGGLREGEPGTEGDVVGRVDVQIEGFRRCRSHRSHRPSDGKKKCKRARDDTHG